MAETATWLTTLKILSTVGEMAHFPYIGGVATCVITLLETIQAAAQNDEDLQELMKSTKDTTEIVTETVTAHEDSAPHFRHVCEELENYLKGVLPEMEKMHLKRNRGLKRFFRVKNISVAIAGFKQRVQKVKEDFMIRVMTDSRFAIADLEDKLTGLEDKLTGLEDKLIASTVAMDAIGASQRDIQKEIHAVGTLQNERMDAILSSIIIQSQARSSCEELAGDLPSYKPLGRVLLASLLETLHNAIGITDNKKTPESRDNLLSWSNNAASSQSSAGIAVSSSSLL